MLDSTKQKLNEILADGDQPAKNLASKIMEYYNSHAINSEPKIVFLTKIQNLRAELSHTKMPSHEKIRFINICQEILSA